jgi:hypothetical protein
MAKHHSYRRGPRRHLMSTRPAAEILTEVWMKWRSSRTKPCFRDFSPQAIERLDEIQPAWRVFADLLDRQAVRRADTRGTRLLLLRGLFLAGKHPVDLIDEPQDAADDGLAVAA